MSIQYNAIDIEKDVNSWEKEDVQKVIEERLPKDLAPLVEWVYGVSNRDRLEIVNLLLEYHDVFSLSGTPLERTNLVEHKIHTHVKHNQLSNSQEEYLYTKEEW